MQIDKISSANITFTKLQRKQNNTADASFQNKLNTRCDKISIQHKVNATGETAFDEYSKARMEKVNELKTKINNDEYNVDSLEVAKAMIAKSRIDKVI